VEAFADGVFAIAATLLILSVDTAVKDPADLTEHWEAYVAYAVSFVTIGVMWLNHHAVMELIARVDLRFLMANIGLLMCIAFVPFPTRLVAEHIREEGAEAATLAYGFTLTITAVFFNLVWFYAARGRRLLRDDVDQRVVDGISRTYLPGPFIYLGAGLVGLVSPGASAILFLAIAALYVVESSIFGGRTTAN
jgi:uncharacterized membrane protein